ncbi:hypothetical protein, partial [uncultured Lamprocystis sp.]|uniref:hypothetical protein n=1 Tax=uncultured Lamprocystis sp. TaxID=543132 RepID=UPI0025D00C18
VGKALDEIQSPGERGVVGEYIPVPPVGKALDQFRRPGQSRIGGEDRPILAVGQERRAPAQVAVGGERN